MASDHAAQLEFHRMQFANSLGVLAQGLRDCATLADGFAYAISHGSLPPTFQPMPPNGQFPMHMVPMQVGQEDGKKRKARGDEGEGKKRAKKPKDPNAPKRPASSYILFQNDVRSELRKKNPEMRNNELLSHIAKLWSEMPQDQKEAYEARNRAEKDKWLAEKAIYESNHNAKAGEASAAPAAPVAVVAPVKAPAPPVAAAPTPASSEESSVEDDSSEDDSNSDDEDAETAPPPKKTKRETAPAKDESTPKKEKKHKKSKA
ncbi:high mobility group box domain-containing protein [Trametes polyzona]|nr:high mobility group box domain-containing protein [Trametes polyzona]